jgi:hypothetical protein
LGVLADLAGMMLDALEAHFVLYGDDQAQLTAVAVPVANDKSPSRPLPGASL